MLCVKKKKTVDNKKLFQLYCMNEKIFIYNNSFILHYKLLIFMS